MDTLHEPSPSDDGSISTIQYSPPNIEAGDSPTNTAIITARDLIYEVPLFHTHPLLNDYSHVVVRGEQWICIGGKAERLPSGAAAMRYGLPVVPPLISNNQLRSAEWYNIALPHRPYLPDATQYVLAKGNDLDQIAWFYLQYTAEHACYFMDEKDQTRVDPELAKTIDDDLVVLRAILKWFGGKAKLTFDIVDLSMTTQGLVAARGAVEVVPELEVLRDQAFELVAAISYNLCHVDCEVSKYCITLYRPFLRYCLAFEPRIGALIDPNDRGLHLYPLLKLVHDRCPVYLPWDYKYRPTTGVIEYLALRTMSSEEFVSRVDKAWPLPNPERGEAPRGSLLSHLSTAEETTPIPKIQRLLDLVNMADCVMGAATKSTVIAKLDRDLEWDAKVIEHGYVIAGGNVEARLRHFSLVKVLDPANPASVILVQALKWALPILLLFPSTTEEIFHSEGAHWDATEPNAFDAVVPTLYISLHLNNQRSWDAFVDRITQVLARPEAVGVVLYGGLLARLAVQFGPDDLIDRVLRGPSSRAHESSYGDAWTNKLFYDKPGTAIITILLGTVAGNSIHQTKSWFPPLESVEKYLTRGFEWNSLCEEWFQDRIRACTNHSAPDACPLSESKWVWSLKDRIRRRAAVITRKVPSDGDSVELQDTLDRECGASWEFLKLSNIKVNLLRGRGVSLNSAA